MMVELPSDFLMKTKKILIQNLIKKIKYIFYYLILLLLLINDDNYGSLCEEFLTSFLLRYHVITHPCSDIIFNNLKKNIFF